MRRDKHGAHTHLDIGCTMLSYVAKRQRLLGTRTVSTKPCQQRTICPGVRRAERVE